MSFNQFLPVRHLTCPTTANNSTHALSKRIRQLELELSNKERELKNKVGEISTNTYWNVSSKCDLQDKLINKHDNRWEMLKQSAGKRSAASVRKNEHDPDTLTPDA